MGEWRPSITARKTKKATILLVDDDLHTQRLLRDLLSARYTVITAISLRAALECWINNYLDLVITEKHLSDGSGSELADYGNDRAPDTRIIMMSTYASVNSVVEVLRRNVVDYLVKPLRSRGEIVHRVQRALSGKQTKPEDDKFNDQSGRHILESLVVRDPLTGLYNHAHFQETLEREIARNHRSNAELSLVIVDIDHFKGVNDSRSHAAGDTCLKEFARILTGKHRYSNQPFCLRTQDFVARYSGDRFALILPDTNKRGAAAKAEQLRAYVESYDFTPHKLPPQTVSVGIASFPEDATDRQGLTQAVEDAVTAAKRRGRNQIICFSRKLVADTWNDSSANYRSHELEFRSLKALERCLKKRTLFYAFQPIVETQTESVFAYEALCRAPEEDFTGPSELFASAERAGRVSDVGKAVRDISLTTMRALPEPYLLFVNLHPLELNSNLIQEAVDNLAPLAQRLVFEITESAAIQDMERLKALMSALRGLGFRFALDDLGAGYAGLNSLAMLEPDFIKLDMALIRGIQSDSRAARLIKHILEYTNGEGMGTIAEGVETQQEYEVVKQLGCPLVQGFFFARPGPPFPQLDTAVELI